MKILNPLYDWAFKYLLDNNELAKKFLTAILKQNVTHLESRNIELPLLKEGNPFYTRFDFKAIIETNGKTKEVLIELQKYRNTDPVSRFRTYLGESYMKEESYKDAKGITQKSALPLIPIYILGYCPPEFTVPYVIVRNKIYNGVDETELNMESQMINQLTHNAYFLITTPPKNYEWQGSRQEAIIRLFRQKLRKEESNTIYELEKEPEDEVAKELAEYLFRGTQEEQIIKQLRAEEEYYEKIGELEIALNQTQQEKEEALKRAEKERKEKEEAKKRAERERKEKEEARKRAEKERKEKEEARKKEEEAIKREKEKSIKLAKMMLKMGKSIDEIRKETGLDKEDIKKLID